MITNEELQLSKMSYTDKDFASIYPDLLDLAKQLTNKWDPSISNESDPGVVLLKEGAFIADHNNYNIDKNILENFLPSATQDRSVRNITEMNGYTPRYYVSASGDVTFTFNGSDEVTKDNMVGFTIPAFSIVLTNDEETIAYTQVSNLSVGNIGVSTTCKFMEGTLNQLTVNNSGAILLENLDENNRVYFPDPYVAENGVFIHCVDDNVAELWERNNYLLTQPTGSKIYKVDFDSRAGLPYVEFPEDIANIIGNGVEINYISTTGINGNVKANELYKIKSPSTFTIPNLGINVDLEDTFSVSNYSSILNGKDPETIDEMYQSFKRIVGTFDTLVTCKDYQNAINEMTDSYDSKLVSNAVVTDIRTDYNNSINIITYDEYGPYFETASLVSGINSYEFTDGTNPKIGDIKYDDNDNYFKVCKAVDNGTGNKWEPITSISYKDFVDASEAMTPYDLCIYALKAFSMADYIDEQPEKALNNSFLPIGNVVRGTIENELHDYKCINHTFKSIKNDDIICFKNYVPLNITIIPYSKVSLSEKNEIIKNIYRALTENFNASMLEFGEELNYDEVVEVLLAADDRIKNIRLEDFQYEPSVLYANGLEESLYSDTKLLVDLVAKNVLAGRLCLFEFDNTFTYGFGQTNSQIYEDIFNIKTEVEISVTAEGESTTQVQNNQDIQSVSFENTGESVYLSVLDESSMGLVSADELGPNSPLTIAAGQFFPLPTDNSYYVRVEYGSTYTDIGPSGGNTNIEIHAINDQIVYYGDGVGDDRVDADNIRVDLVTQVPSAEVESYDFKYTLKDNEYIEVAYPNYYSSIIYPTYCNYRFVSDDKTTVYSNTDYELEQGEYLYIMYTSDGVEQSVTYGPGTIINTTFNMTPTGSAGITKNFGSNGTLMAFTTLGSGQQIAIRQKLETRLQNTNTPCYWIRNNSSNILFKEITERSQIGTEGYSWVVLDSGEYFIYSNTTLDSMVILGTGTRISRSLTDKSQWAISSDIINIETISTNGFNSNITWQYKDFTQNSLSLQEMNLVILGSGDEIYVANWAGNSLTQIPDKLNNNWVPCYGVIYYKPSGSNKQTVLKQLNIEDGYIIRSRLDLVTDNYNGQRLITGNGSTQTITVTTGPDTEETISAESSSEGDVNDLYLQSSVPLDLVGGDSMNIDLITANNTINFLSYNQVLPERYIGGELVEQLTSSDNKYVVTLSEPGYLKFPFTYENTFSTYDDNTKEYIIPVYVTGNDAFLEENPITASFKLISSSGTTSGEPFSIHDYGYDDSSDDSSDDVGNTFLITKSGMYLLTPGVTTGLTESIESSEGADPEPITFVNIKSNMALNLEWDTQPNEAEIVTVFEPKISLGLNYELQPNDNSIDLYSVVTRIKELVADSTKPTVKPYYINEPEQSIAIQDPDITNPNILWDNNNVANIITIPQIILPSDNIDIIKSMKGYSLKEDK